MAGQKRRAESDRPEPRAARRTADPVLRPIRPSTFTQAGVLGLQRAVGNQAIARTFTVAQPNMEAQVRQARGGGAKLPSAIGGTRLHRAVTQPMLVQRMAVKIENKGEAKEFEHAKPLVKQFTTEEPIDFATADFSGLTAAEPLVIWSHADGWNVGGKVGGALADELYKQGLRTCAELRILGCNHAGHPQLILGFLKAGFQKYSDLGRFPMYATTGQLHWTNLTTGEHLPVENWWVALETGEERGQKAEHKGALKKLRGKWEGKLDSYRQEREELYREAKERGDTTVTTTYYGETLTYPIEEFLEKHGALEDEADQKKAGKQVKALKKEQKGQRLELREGLYKGGRYPTIGSSPPSDGRGGWKDAADSEAFAVHEEEEEEEKKKKKPWAPWVRDWSRDE